MTAAAPSADDQLSELRTALRLLRRHWLLVGLGLVLGLASGLVWLATREPVYRATATLLLESGQTSGGVLGELAALSRAPAAVAEMALLESRSLAAEAVRAPEDGTIPTPDNPAALRHLGLETVVEDPSRRPLNALAARFLGGHAGGRLYARAVEVREGAPETVEVRFRDDGVVVLTPRGSGSGGAALERPYVPGETYDCAGLVLRLDHEGDLTGRRLLVHHRSATDAINAVLGATRVVETQRNSGVIAVTVDDSDPARAAAIANALCFNYFDLNVERNQRRASQTVDFIEGQLEAQLAALEEAEREVVALQSESPDALDVTVAAQGLIGDLSELEVRRMQLELERSSIREALTLLERGEDDALSRLSSELSDPLSTSLLEQLGMLNMELLLGDRPAGDPLELLLEQRAAELRGAADELALEINAVHETLRAIDDGRPGALASLSDRPGSGVEIDPLTRGYLAEIARLEAERDALAQEFRPEYPPLISLEQQLTELHARVRTSLAGRLDALRSLFEDRMALVERAGADAADLPARTGAVTAAARDELRLRIRRHLDARSAAMAQVLAELDGYIARLEARLGALPERQRELSSPLRRLETHKEIATFLMKSLQEAEITRASTVASADFVDPATAPRMRSAPRVGMTLVLACLAGLGAGFGLAWLRENLRRTLTGPSELEALTGLPVLATVPDFTRGRSRVAAAGQDFIALRDDPEGTVAEAYRSLRANLRFALGDVAALRTLAATSCAPGEGKSTTNVDIAWAFASGGRRVLLVDADMRRPSVHRYLGLDRGPGLAEALSGAVDWRQVVQSTPNPLLSVLTAGQIRGVAGDALNGARAGELLDELIAGYDLVVFDLPPALAVADVETFAHRLDALLLLYRADGVPADAVRVAVTRLRQTGANLVGSILNAYRSERGLGGDSYYGGYGYSEYGPAAATEEGGRRGRRHSA